MHVDNVPLPHYVNFATKLFFQVGKKCVGDASVSLMRCKNYVLKKHSSNALLSASKSENRQVTGFTILIFPHRMLC